MTAQILDTSSAGAIRHKVSEHVTCKTNAEVRQSDWPKARTIAQETVSGQSPVLAGLRGKHGVTAVGNGWAVTHADTSMSSAIATYGQWFSQAGLMLTPANGTSNNVAAYDLTGLEDELRVVFHREGSGVRVYIGAK